MISKIFHLGLLYFLIFYDKISAKSIEEEEKEAQDFITGLNEETAKDLTREAHAAWKYANDLTVSNLNKQLAISSEVAKNRKKAWQKVIKFNWKKFSDPSLKRQFQKYSILGSSALPEYKFNRLTKIVNDMESIYSTATICPFKGRGECTLSLNPDLSTILATSRDPKELKHVWVQWRNQVGPKCRELFKEYVDLSNEAARMNNFRDNSEYWVHDYDDPNFSNVVQRLWLQMKPLYLQIHAYVRTKLREKYGDIVSENGPIPAHLLGNMWAQSWTHVGAFMLPYPNVKDVDLTAQLKKQKYTATKIFKTAEAFFKSIGLSEMPDTFWEKSILEKIPGRDMVCHAEAVDFMDGKDFRIKQCTQVIGEHFITAHHEMGHVEYFIQYKNQPRIFRDGANDGFHEAIGDLIALSVQSANHLKKMNLWPSKKDDPRQVLNNLFKLGLDKITFLPFGYLVDLWRWDVFSGKTKPEDYNCKWWHLREIYQGVEPPVGRTEKDFDPAGKYHVVGNVPYLRYFMSFVLQYQFHRALCVKAGQYEPNNPKKQLHECDIYENTEAGSVLKKMLEMGSSKPWPDALEVITGQRTMDATAILDYFKPLHDWLEKENKKNNAYIGWHSARNARCRGSPGTFQNQKMYHLLNLSAAYLLSKLLMFY